MSTKCQHDTCLYPLVTLHYNGNVGSAFLGNSAGSKLESTHGEGRRFRGIEAIVAMDVVDE